MVESVWQGLPERFQGIEPDEFVVMPNHIHFTLFLVGAPLVGALSNQNARAGTRPAPTNVGEVVGAFKSLTTHAYTIGVSQSIGRVPGRLWQRNYYERLIRNDAELEKFSAYILHNPDRWVEDEENPLFM